jgi:hypothetical protein
MKTFTIKCDQVKKHFRTSEELDPGYEAAKHFAGIIARREYGRKGFCMTHTFLSAGVVQAFIGTPSQGGGCSGRNVIFNIEIISETQ